MDTNMREEESEGVEERATAANRKERSLVIACRLQRLQLVEIYDIHKLKFVLVFNFSFCICTHF